MAIEKTSLKVIKTQKWSFELKFYEDGTSTLTRENDGFNPLELLGLASKAQAEILQQISGIIKPTTTNRVIIE